MPVIKDVRVLIGVTAALVVGAAIGWLLLRDAGTSKAAEIRFSEPGGTAMMLPADVAVDRASAQAGFPVKVPSVLPDSRLKLAGINVNNGPEGVSNALKIVSVFLEVPSASASPMPLQMVVQQTGGTFGAPEDLARPVDIGVAGVKAYTQKNAAGVVSYWVVGTRSYFVYFTGIDIPAEQAIIPTLRDLAR
jgi:hypothetical protein